MQMTDRVDENETMQHNFGGLFLSNNASENLKLKRCGIVAVDCGKICFG
jgi:hypothetical protein